MRKKPLVLFLVGPTAGGKSDTAVELAKIINAEIISADSMQVYKKTDILTAKPLLKDRKRIKHYLIDELEPHQEYSAAIFCKKANELIKRIHAKNKIPLVVGGTGLYVRSLINGLFEDKGKDYDLRKKLYAVAQEKGNEFLYNRLKKLDPEAAEKIHFNNLKRVVRALEAIEVNKEKFSSLKMKIKPLSERYDIKMFALKWDREELYARIEARVDEMFKKGIVDEVKNLNVLNMSSTLMQAIGIKQINEYLSGKISLEQAIELLKRDTRRYAKRQITWFGREENIRWIPSDNDSSAVSLAEKICTFL